MESNKLFRGRLGHLEERYRDASRRLQPFSVPGMLVSRTTRGVTMKPIARPARSPAPTKVEEVYVERVYDDFLSVTTSEGERLVAKAYPFWCSLWAGANSWTPGAPFRYNFDYLSHPLISTVGATRIEYDYTYVDAELRAMVVNRPMTIAHLGTFSVTREPQAIWPPYTGEHYQYVASGEKIWIMKVASIQGPPRSEALNGDSTLTYQMGDWPVGTKVEWIDKNTAGRRWRSIPEIIYYERTFDYANGGGDAVLINGGQA